MEVGRVFSNKISCIPYLCSTIHKDFSLLHFRGFVSWSMLVSFTKKLSYLPYAISFIAYCRLPAPQQSLRGRKLWWEGSFVEFWWFGPCSRELNSAKKRILCRFSNTLIRDFIAENVTIICISQRILTKIISVKKKKKKKKKKKNSDWIR